MHHISGTTLAASLDELSHILLLAPGMHGVTKACISLHGTGGSRMDPLLEALDQAQLQQLLLKCGIIPARADAYSQRLAGAYTRKGLLAVATDPDLVASILAGDGAAVLGQHKADAKAIQRYIAGGIDELASG